MTLFWDIDGPLRRLDLAAFGKEPSTWGAVDKAGRDLVKIVTEQPSLCLLSMPSEYFPVLNSQQVAIILSNQPKSWQIFTRQWLKLHLQIPYTTIFSKGDKLRYLKPEDYIVEDYPFFNRYDQVILIDRLYNQEVDCPIRVKTPEELQAVLKRIETGS